MIFWKCHQAEYSVVRRFQNCSKVFLCWFYWIKGQLGCEFKEFNACSKSLAIVKKDHNCHYLHAIFYFSLKKSNSLDSKPAISKEKHSPYMVNMWTKKILNHEHWRKHFHKMLFSVARFVVHILPTLKFAFFVVA